MKTYRESLHSQSELPPYLPPPLSYGSHWTHIIADFMFFPYTSISFIIAFTALEWIPYMESLCNQSDLPPDPLYGSNCDHNIVLNNHNYNFKYLTVLLVFLFKNLFLLLCNLASNL